MTQPSIRPGTYRLAVESIREETPEVKTFRLAFPKATEFTFVPGMFVMLSFPDSPKLTRAYSMASSPLEKGYVEISLNKVAEFTARLFDLKGGETLVAKGPYGKWLYSDDLHHVVLISGGTGITPFRSISRYVIQKGLPNRVTILYSSRTPSDIIYRKELEEFARHPNFVVVTTVTRPHLLKSGERWDGPTGRINLKMIHEAVPDFPKAHYYMCGPNSLVENISSALETEGIPKDQIRYEKWGEY